MARVQWSRIREQILRGKFTRVRICVSSIVESGAEKVGC